MTSTHVLPGVIPSVLSQDRSRVLRDVATKTLYFSLVAIVFVFVSILLTGAHP
jgi:hypothetical protein